LLKKKPEKLKRKNRQNVNVEKQKVYHHFLKTRLRKKSRKNKETPKLKRKKQN